MKNPLNEIGCIGLPTGDNLGIALIQYFDDHPESPEDPELDDNQNSVWSVARTNEVLKLIHQHFEGRNQQ